MASALLLLSLVNAQPNLWKNRFVKQWQPFGSSDSSVESNNVVAIESNGNFGSQNVGGFSNQPSAFQSTMQQLIENRELRVSLSGKATEYAANYQWSKAATDTFLFLYSCQ